jgi:uncharacterized membrane protein
VRNRLSQTLGERRFLLIYTLIAAVSLTLLALTIAQYGGEGLPGSGLATLPAARWGLGAVALIGAALAAAGLENYSCSPMAVLARRLRAPQEDKLKPLRAPSGVERITRHPFFVGMALLMGAHAPLASTLASAVYFAGFALLALIGIQMQDRKLRARHGNVYGDYLDVSSAIPFAATRPLPDGGTERVWPILLAMVAGAAVLAALHPIWRLGHGAMFAVVVTLGGLYAVAMQFRRSRQPQTLP